MKNTVMWDLICYVIFPLVIWNALNDRIDEYYAMLISTVPGIIYSIIRFIRFKRLNFFGLFMIGTLMIGTLVDVLSGSAIQMLWNNVVYSLVISVFHLVMIFVNKPVSLLFALDLTEMQGYDRQFLKGVYYQPEILKVFKLIACAMALSSLVPAGINSWLIMQYGVDAFTKGIIIKRVIGVGLGLAIIYGYYHINQLSKKLEEPQETIAP